VKVRQGWVRGEWLVSKVGTGSQKIRKRMRPSKGVELGNKKRKTGERE